MTGQLSVDEWNYPTAWKRARGACRFTRRSSAAGDTSTEEMKVSVPRRAVLFGQILLD